MRCRPAAASPDPSTPACRSSVGQLARGVDVVEVDGHQRGQLGDRARRDPSSRARSRPSARAGCPSPVGARHERRGALERLHRLVGLPGLAQRAAERHLHRDSCAGSRRRASCSAVGRHLAAVLDAFGHRQRAAHGAEHPLERLVEADLQLIEIGVQRGLERRVGVEALRRRRAAACAARRRRRRSTMCSTSSERLVVGERDRLRILERRIKTACPKLKGRNPNES